MIQREHSLKKVVQKQYCFLGCALILSILFLVHY